MSPIKIGLLAAASVAVIGGVVLGNLWSTGPATAHDRLSREDVEKIVRDYIMENPEVILESVEKYADAQAEIQAAEAEERQAAALEEAKDYLPTLMSASAGSAIGAAPDAAEVLVVEFFDYNCGYCRRATDFVFNLTEENDDIRVVFQDLPVVDREASPDAAIAALAYSDEGNYAELHRTLMKSAGRITADRVAEIAAEEGFDPEIARQALADESRRAAIESKVELSREIGEALLIQGTPAFLVTSPDGSVMEMVPGYDAESVRAAIEAARKG